MEDGIGMRWGSLAIGDEGEMCRTMLIGGGKSDRALLGRWRAPSIHQVPTSTDSIRT